MGQTLTAVQLTGASHGTATLSANGILSYQANPGYSGLDSFTYDVTAGGLTSNVATVTLTVVGTTPPTPPVANPDAYPVVGSTLSVPSYNGVLANDTNPTGQPMTAAVVTYASHGMVMLNPDGSFTYYAGMGYSGTDTFSYQAYANGVASNVATVTLNVVAPTPPTPPVANPDAYPVGGSSLTVSGPGVLANDSNPSGQSMTAQVVTGPGHGWVMLSPTGGFSYYAYGGYSGTDTFTYDVTAGGVTSNVATVTLTVDRADAADRESTTPTRSGAPHCTSRPPAASSRTTRIQAASR